jgi:predicted translin family RNA/ssDNA-binding protein
MMLCQCSAFHFLLYCCCRYLGGVLDFTGELNRWAILKATLRDKAAVERARDVVDAIMGRFLEVGTQRTLRA